MSLLLLRCCKFKLKFVAFKDTGGSFLWWHRRGRTCISVSRVFAILILWRTRLHYQAGMSVCTGRLLTTPLLSEVCFHHRTPLFKFVSSISSFIYLSFVLIWMFSNPLLSFASLSCHQDSSTTIKKISANLQPTMYGHSNRDGKTYGREWERNGGG